MIISTDRLFSLELADEIDYFINMQTVCVRRRPACQEMFVMHVQRKDVYVQCRTNLVV